MNLQTIHCEVLEMRRAQQVAIRNRIRQLRGPAGALAQRFDAFEMLILLAVYERMPTISLHRIDVEAANTESPEDALDGALSQTLASFLVYFLTVQCDYPLHQLIALHDDRRTFNETMDLLFKTADKVRVLSSVEAVALQLILEGSRSIPAALHHYDHWWHPDMMLRLLEQPYMDNPEYGCAEIRSSDHPD